MQREDPFVTDGLRPTSSAPLVVPARSRDALRAWLPLIERASQFREPRFRDAPFRRLLFVRRESPLSVIPRLGRHETDGALISYRGVSTRRACNPPLVWARR